MKHVGYWSGTGIEIVEVDDNLYALSEWNGEKYTNCWKCVDQRTVDPEEPGRFISKPIHRFMVEGIDLDSLEENSEDWENAVEIVDYDMRWLDEY